VFHLVIVLRLRVEALSETRESGGGIHYHSAVEDGIAIGKKVVNQVLAHHF
jgi:hypothetical protein